VESQQCNTNICSVKDDDDDLAAWEIVLIAIGYFLFCCLCFLLYFFCFKNTQPKSQNNKLSATEDVEEQRHRPASVSAPAPAPVPGPLPGPVPVADHASNEEAKSQLSIRAIHLMVPSITLTMTY
jgi:hypothetical protein